MDSNDTAVQAASNVLFFHIINNHGDKTYGEVVTLLTLAADRAHRNLRLLRWAGDECSDCPAPIENHDDGECLVNPS